MQLSTTLQATYTAAERQTLLTVARRSIAHGCAAAQLLDVDVDAYPESLRVRKATFVTLFSNGALRGSMGTVLPTRPLVADVAVQAFSAANRDPRFSPVRLEEVADLVIRIAVLGSPEPLAFRSEAELVRRLRPGIDGLMIDAGGKRGTFLPAVWESVPDPVDFWSRLKEKAGLNVGTPPASIRVSRYDAESW